MGEKTDYDFIDFYLLFNFSEVNVIYSQQQRLIERLCVKCEERSQTSE